MTSITISRDETVIPARLASAIRGLFIALALGALSLPLLLAAPGPLSGDESRYLAEGLNLALGKGFTYTTGGLVTDHGPVYPALLAGELKLSGGALDGVSWLPRLFALANAALALALGWRLFGRATGLLAAAAALVSSFLLLMGSGVHAEVVQVSFLLLSLLALEPALRGGSIQMAALSGAALGLATLTDGSALLWLPLPLVAMTLLGPAVDRRRALLLAYGGAFLAAAGWWWAYLFAASDTFYLVDTLEHGAVWLAAGSTFVAVATLSTLAVSGRGRAAAAWRWPVTGLVLAAWVGLVLAALEASATPAFPRDYLGNGWDYARTDLSSWLRPLPLIGVAWVYVTYRAARGSLGDRLLLLAFVLELPFVLFAANRDLELRELLPAVYLSYLALARSAIDFGQWLSEAGREALSPALSSIAAVVVVLAGFSWFALTEIDRFGDMRDAFSETAVASWHWDNPLARESAAWIEAEVPPGTAVMSARLYGTRLYALTNGAYPMYELPAVRVELAGEPPAAVRAASLVPSEGMATGGAAPWLYLRRDAQRGSYIGLSERDLLAAIAAHEIGYLVLTGDDGTLSSLSLLPYFQDHPAFTPVRSLVADERNQVHVFAVDAGALASTSPPARVSQPTSQALQQAFGAERAHELLIGLSPAGYVVTETFGTEVSYRP